MSDFDDLRQIREAKEDAEAAARERAQDEQKQHANAQRRLREKLIADAQLFDAAVTDVLENLRKAVYTSARSSTFDYLEVRGSAGSWSIGMSDS